MSYVSDFEHDIFISYAHDDNQSRIAKAGWVQQFHAALEQTLIEKWGRRNCPSIWRDPRLQGNEVFAETLSDELRKVAVIISVVSPNYLESDWCKRELNEFRQAAEQRGGFTLDRKVRAFKVIKTHIERDQEPEDLQGITGYRFYKYDAASKRTTAFKLTPDDDNLTAALNLIEDMANDIMELLDKIRQSKGDTANTTEEPTESADTPALASSSIYLAETSLHLDAKRSVVKRDLEARGHKVLPDGDLPRRSAGQFKDAVRDALNQCQMSIHMIGEERDHVLPGATNDVVYLQNELAAEQCRERKMSRLVWLPPGMTATDEDQRKFVNMLQTDLEVQKNAEVLEVDLQQFMTHIHDTLNKQEKVPEKAAEIDRPKRVYVIAAQEDKANARALGKCLFSQGFAWLKPLSDSKATEKEMFEIHKRNLVDCDAAIVYWGEARESWVMTQMSEMQRGVGWRQGKPMKVAVYLAGPETDEKEDFTSHDLVLKNYGDFSADTLAPFFEQNGKST
jgi:hypothetical protein